MNTTVDGIGRQDQKQAPAGVKIFRDLKASMKACSSGMIALGYVSVM
mgnify:CR=1 FL=1